MGRWAMGRESKVVKQRQCRVCANRFRVSTAELAAHVRECAEHKNQTDRMAALGLVVPQLSLDAAELLAKQRR